MGRHADEAQDDAPPPRLSLRARLGLAATAAVTTLLVTSWAGVPWLVAAAAAGGAGVVVLVAAWVADTGPPPPSDPVK